MGTNPMAVNLNSRNLKDPGSRVPVEQREQYLKFLHNQIADTMKLLEEQVYELVTFLDGAADSVHTTGALRNHDHDTMCNTASSDS